MLSRYDSDVSHKLHEMAKKSAVQIEDHLFFMI